MLPPPPTTAEILADLCDAFYSERPPERTVAVYVRELADVDPFLLQIAVRVLIRESLRFPKVAQIRKTAAEYALALPTEAEALASIEQRIAWGRLDDESRGDVPSIHPIVRSCLDHVGGFFAFRSTEDASILIGQFGRLYREERGRAVRDAQVFGRFTSGPALTRGDGEPALRLS